jgi:hypothetical protein
VLPETSCLLMMTGRASGLWTVFLDYGNRDIKKVEFLLLVSI